MLINSTRAEKMEKITFRGNAYLALQSNSEKLNEHRFFLLREVSYCEKAFQKQQNMLLEKQTNKENSLKKRRQLFWYDLLNM